MRPTFKQVRALVALLAIEDYPYGTGCDNFGAAYFGERRSGRISSVNGGGDYAAQMTLGRLRKLGWTSTQTMDGHLGSSRWMLTASGRAIARFWADRSS